MIDRRELLKVIRTYLGPYYFYKKVSENLEAYSQMGITNDEIKSTLDYWYGEKKNDPAKSGGGIRIVEYVRNEAKEYWQNKSKKEQAIKNMPEYSEPQIQQIVIQKTPIKKPTRVRLFELP